MPNYLCCIYIFPLYIPFAIIVQLLFFLTLMKKTLPSIIEEKMNILPKKINEKERCITSLLMMTKWRRVGLVDDGTATRSTWQLCLRVAPLPHFRIRRH